MKDLGTFNIGYTIVCACGNKNPDKFICEITTDEKNVVVEHLCVFCEKKFIAHLNIKHKKIRKKKWKET